MNQPVTQERIQAQARREPASEATKIEQSRAIAQVQAAYVMAQQRPRDEALALAQALKSCQTKEVAEDAFFKFKRGDGTVSGPTIHLAVELARVWGNIDYGIAELGRSDEAGMSEMLAYSCDLQTNTRSSMVFLVPHRRDTKHGARLLTDMRDIYENNANMGARRLRECIFRVLPSYLKEAAQAECHKTLRSGGQKPLQVSLAEMVKAFEEIGISRARLEAKHGAIGQLTDVDLANLKVSYRSLARKEIDPDEEFPRVGTEEATAKARRLASPADGKADAPVEKEPETILEELEAGDRRRGGAEIDTPDDTPHPARARADEIIAEAGDKTNMPDLNSLRSNVKADVAAMPDDIAAEVERALDEAEKRIRGGQG